MIIEYKRHQLALIQYPKPPLAESVINPTPSPEVLHIISPDPKALPTPPWFLDDLYEDFPPNPPNSPIHLPVEILHPTNIFNPNYLDIWFMSRKRSQSPCITLPTSSPPKDNYVVIVTNVVPLDPLYS